MYVQEKEQSELRAHSSSIRGSKMKPKISESSAKGEKYQPFIKEDVLTEIYNVCLVLFYFCKYSVL